MSKSTKWVILSSAGILLVGTLSAVLYAARPYIYSGDIAAELARLRAAGKPVSEEDLAPPSIPERENAENVYREAFVLLKRDGYYAGVQRRAPSGWYGPRNAEYWLAAREYVAAAQDALAIAAEAARMPKCAFREGWWPDFAPEHVSRLRTLARVFAVRATLNARDNKMNEAVEDLKSIIGISQSVRDEPSMASALSQAAIVRTAAEALGECLSYHTVTTRQARELYDQFGRIDLKSSFVKALEGARAALLTQLDKIQARAVGGSTQPGTEIEKVLGRWAPLLLKAQIRVEKRILLQEMAKTIREADLSYRDFVLRRSRPHNDRPFARRAMVAPSLVPAFDRARAARDHGIAAAAGSRIALALEAHCNAKGTYPNSLSELTKEPGWKIEKDPFSAADFIYKKLPKGFLLYSIGEDFEDDGGSFDGNPGQHSAGSFGRRGDIVWRVER